MTIEQTPNGIVTIQSRYSVDETAARLEGVLDERGVKLFAKIDHSGEAKKAGLHMPNTKLFIFGNPRGGTPLMIAAPTIALDLPLKILIWEDSGSSVFVTYNTQEFLARRHNLPLEFAQVLSATAAIATEITG